MRQLQKPPPTEFACAFLFSKVTTSQKAGKKQMHYVYSDPIWPKKWGTSIFFVGNLQMRKLPKTDQTDANPENCPGGVASVKGCFGKLMIDFVPGWFRSIHPRNVKFRISFYRFLPSTVSFYQKIIEPSKKEVFEPVLRRIPGSPNHHDSQGSTFHIPKSPIHLQSIHPLRLPGFDDQVGRP